MDTTPIISSHYQKKEGELYTAAKYPDTSDRRYKIYASYFQPFLQSSHAMLDFGCGSGGMLHILSESVHRADGLEVNESAAMIARSLGHEIYPSISALPTEPIYDVVISNHVFEHIRDPATTLELLRPHIKHGGLLLLKLPMEDWRAHQQRKWIKDDIDHHLHTWTPKLAGNLLDEAGYEIEDIRIITSAISPRILALTKWGLLPLASWALSILAKRRQLFVVARTPLTNIQPRTQP